MDVDKDLIKRCIREERKAQFELYQVCYAPMIQICLRYEKNKEDATAVLNHAFLKICENLNSFENKTPFEFWMRRITINTAIDYYRKRKTQAEHYDIQDTSEHYWESQIADINLGEAELNADSLRALIRALPPVSQQAFNLHVIDGYDYEEVAEMLGVSESTCRWHVHFARKKLQEMIKTVFHSTKSVKL